MLFWKSLWEIQLPFSKITKGKGKYIYNSEMNIYSRSGIAKFHFFNCVLPCYINLEYQLQFTGMSIFGQRWFGFIFDSRLMPISESVLNWVKIFLLRNGVLRTIFDFLAYNQFLGGFSRAMHNFWTCSPVSHSFSVKTRKHGALKQPQLTMKAHFYRRVFRRFSSD